MISLKLKLNLPILFKSIDEILNFLFNRKEKIVLALDEYTYLSKEIKGLDSIIQSIIDMNKEESNLKLILSGS